MLDGKYNLKMNTQMGAISGNLSLKTEGNALKGTLETMGMKNDFSGGTVEGNKCNFSGEFKTMIGNITYDITGVLEGEKLNIYANTNNGEISIVKEKI